MESLYVVFISIHQGGHKPYLIVVVLTHFGVFNFKVNVDTTISYKKNFQFALIPQYNY